MQNTQKDEYAYRLLLPKELEKKIKQHCVSNEIKIKDFILKAILKELKDDKRDSRVI